MTNRHRADVHARCTRVGVRTRQRQRARTSATLRQTETPRHHTRHRPRRRIRNLHRRISRQRHRARQRARRREIHRTSRRQTRTSNRQWLLRRHRTSNLQRRTTRHSGGCTSAGTLAQGRSVGDLDRAVVDVRRTGVCVGRRQRQRARVARAASLDERSAEGRDWVGNRHVARPEHGQQVTCGICGPECICASSRCVERQGARGAADCYGCFQCHGARDGVAVREIQQGASARTVAAHAQRLGYRQPGAVEVDCCPTVHRCACRSGTQRGVFRDAQHARSHRGCTRVGVGARARQLERACT